MSKLSTKTKGCLTMKRMKLIAMIVLALAAAALVLVIVKSADMRAQTMISGASFVYSKQSEKGMEHEKQTVFPPLFGETDYTSRGVNDTEIRSRQNQTVPGIDGPMFAANSNDFRMDTQFR